MHQIYFFTAPNYQNYYLTALSVANISCIPVLSKFQTFQLKEDKIRNQSRNVAANSGLGCQVQIGTFFVSKVRRRYKRVYMLVDMFSYLRNQRSKQILSNYALFSKNWCRKLLKKKLEYENILYNSTELAVD